MWWVIAWAVLSAVLLYVVTSLLLRLITRWISARTNSDREISSHPARRHRP
jgi:putative effector of murein hydrolase LrgA (UPF0299 family)